MPLPFLKSLTLKNVVAYSQIICSFENFFGQAAVGGMILYNSLSVFPFILQFVRGFSWNFAITFL